MKKQILFAVAWLLPLALMATANAFTISIADSFTVSHNSHLFIPITLTNSDTFILYNSTITATNILTGSAMTATPSSNRTINASNTASYTLDYSIPQYTYTGAYVTNITLSAQDINGTLSYASKNVTINVNSSQSMSVSTTTVSHSVTAGAISRTSFTITNTGNANLTNIAITQQSTLNDSDGNTITLSISSDKNLGSLAPGSTATIYINASVPKAQQRKAYSTGLVINSTEGIGAIVTYQPTVRLSYCDSGIVGSDFVVTIKEPRENDDFYPNNDIPVTIRVKNNNNDDRDVLVYSDVYDETDDQFLDVEYSTDATINGDSSEDFEFTLKLPLDVSNTHDYKIFAKAYEDGNEDGQCNEDYTAINIKRDSHSIVIDKTEIPTTAGCDESFDFKVRLANAGKNDEDVKLQIVNSELKISEEKLVSINSGDTRTITIPINIPKNTVEKDYTFVARAYFHLSNDEYQNDVSTSKAVKVEGNCIQVVENTVISAEVLSDAFIKEQFGIKLTVFNTGTITAAYNIVASNYDSWAQLDKVEPATLTVEAGKSAATYIYLTPFDNTAGTHTITLDALYGSKKVEKTLNIAVNDKMTATSAYQKLSQRLSNLSGFDLATVNIVLVVAIILVFIWIIRVRRAY